MSRSLVFLLLTFVFIAIDWYVWQALKVVIRSASPNVQRWVTWLYWGFTAITLASYILVQFLPPDTFGRTTRNFVISGIAIPYFAKIFAALFLLIDDVRRLVQWAVSLVVPPAADPTTDPSVPRIPRSEFMSSVALVAGGSLFGTFAFGIISGAHDYRIRRVKIPLKNLPSAFNGMRIAQLSDIHSGSFFNRTAVKGGVEMLLKEKPDLALFTGDLVNDRAEEVKNYMEIFGKVKAPLGVYSVLGNHDYGDYANWSSQAEKRQNLRDLIKAHDTMGWRLLMDENVPIQVDGEEIGLIGIQNWGMGGFAQYGDLSKAYQGAEKYPVKLLLSHDPSHWNAQVTPKYKDIDVAFAGHTHGMQFGVEIGGFQWSPVQYRYKQWGGLYEQDDQYLYVNRGFGYIGYPGRVGILPEITIIELVKA
ncbi:metallophosphoesterase [Telluribacter humicola]|uniref:metallophosphoesterase n=1 Tax=Telluribacter humicola TaxID=1720261 RepID=UPI001A97C5C2|nr:metallophosphoesterase [Telluribacter humicola]